MSDQNEWLSIVGREARREVNYNLGFVPLYRNRIDWRKHPIGGSAIPSPRAPENGAIEVTRMQEEGESGHEGAAEKFLDRTAGHVCEREGRGVHVHRQGIGEKVNPRHAARGVRGLCRMRHKAYAGG